MKIFYDEGKKVFVAAGEEGERVESKSLSLELDDDVIRGLILHTIGDEKLLNMYVRSRYEYRLDYLDRERGRYWSKNVAKRVANSGHAVVKSIRDRALEAIALARKTDEELTPAEKLRREVTVFKTWYRPTQKKPW